MDVDVDVPVKQLSTANQQLVVIARALAGDARAVIMDEPTSSLSGDEVERLFGIIRELTERGVGVDISHRLDEIFEIADRITVMRDGAHIETKPASDLDAEQLVKRLRGQEDARRDDAEVRRLQGRAARGREDDLEGRGAARAAARLLEEGRRQVRLLVRGERLERGAGAVLVQ